MNGLHSLQCCHFTVTLWRLTSHMQTGKSVPSVLITVCFLPEGNPIQFKSLTLFCSPIHPCLKTDPNKYTAYLGLGHLFSIHLALYVFCFLNNCYKPEYFLPCQYLTTCVISPSIVSTPSLACKTATMWGGFKKKLASVSSKLKEDQQSCQLIEDNRRSVCILNSKQCLSSTRDGHWLLLPLFRKCFP